MKGWTQAMTCGAQPNQRLKLAPVVNESGGRPDARCSRIPFVNTSSLRRSLSAVRWAARSRDGATHAKNETNNYHRIHQCSA